MKLFLRILMLLAAGMMVFNATIIDWSSPTEGDSLVAVIGVFASASALLLLIILNVSLKIKAKIKN